MFSIVFPTALVHSASALNSIVCADFALDVHLDLTAPFVHETALGCRVGQRFFCTAVTGDALFSIS